MTVTVFTFAALLVLSNAAQLGASVVCVGSDGHIDVRPSFCACCSAPDSHGERVPSELAPAIPSCSDCVEVPVMVTSVESRAPQLSVPQITAEGRIVAQSGARSFGTGLLFPGSRMDQQRQSLSPLSTVVILT